MIKPDGTTITVTADGTATAAGGGGGSFPLIAPDAAIALQGTDATSGFSLDAAGLPGLTDGPDSLSVKFSAAAGLNNNFPGAVINNFLSIGPAVSGSSTLELDGAGQSTEIDLVFTQGTMAAPTAVQANDNIAKVVFLGGAGAVNGYAIATQISVKAAENFDASHAAASYELFTTDLAESFASRYLVDSHGDTNINNGVLTLNPDGANAGLAIAGLPSPPVLGMVSFVNNALAPAVGVAVAGTGTAKALVWYNGTQWTVIGI
jgi:hypothetical protein